VEELESSIDYRALAAAQEQDPELRELRQGTTLLQLKWVQIPGTNTPITCDVSTTAARPFVTHQFRKAALNSVHRLSHPCFKATVKLATQ
jgi:predicted PilT family ATPase